MPTPVPYTMRTATPRHRLAPVMTMCAASLGSSCGDCKRWPQLDTRSNHKPAQGTYACLAASRNSSFVRHVAMDMSLDFQFGLPAQSNLDLQADGGGASALAAGSATAPQPRRIGHRAGGSLVWPTLHAMHRRCPTASASMLSIECRLVHSAQPPSSCRAVPTLHPSEKATA